METIVVILVLLLLIVLEVLRAYTATADLFAAVVGLLTDLVELVKALVEERGQGNG